MKVTVYYETKNKRLAENKKHRRTISFIGRDDIPCLAPYDFERIKDGIKKYCRWDDTVIMRKIIHGNDEYMGCW